MLHKPLSIHTNQDIIAIRKKLPGWKDVALRVAGFLKSDGSFYWEQFTGEISIHFIHSGRGVFEVDGTAYEAKGGDLFVFWPSRMICYGDYPESPWCYSWISFGSDEHSPIMRAAGLRPEEPLLTPVNQQEIRQKLSTCFETLSTGHYSSLYPVHAAMELIDLISRGMKQTREETTEPLGHSVKRLIDSSHFSVLSLSELSDIFSVDRSTIYKAFRSEYGSSVKEYIDSVRLDKACRMLKTRGVSIKEVCYSCGYSDPRYFSRAFKKRYGHTPSSWQKERD